MTAWLRGAWGTRLNQRSLCVCSAAGPSAPFEPRPVLVLYVSFYLYTCLPPLAALLHALKQCREEPQSTGRGRSPPHAVPPGRPSDAHCMPHPSSQAHGNSPLEGSLGAGHFSPRDLLRGRSQVHLDSPERRRMAGHGSLTNISRHESLKKTESPPLRRSTSSGQYTGFAPPHAKTLDPETIAQDIEETMNSALNELRELERQSSANHAPDVVLDTLEQVKNAPTPGGSAESFSPLHGYALRATDHHRRGNGAGPSSSPEALSTFKPVLAPRMGVQLKPPALRPKPLVLPKSGPAQPPAPPPHGPLDKSCTM
ncbi:hypothetical protein SKAU_G00044200 [Synaphobranchus kaupii]|uniref:SLIT-ROBO Rho GTPase activating protein 1 n=1 Tax=Synaphobranchus kaupii TaxID=118154 RepID=A0A9Q1G1V7_SYNKA|nr:hypothetical protein SKAU_G00044200 [Synaphobranchus kaupii]